MKPHKTRRSPEEDWKALERQAANDEMERIIALTPEELDAELRAAGFDPEEVGEAGARIAREAPGIIAAEHEREEQQLAARRRVEARLGSVRDIPTLRKMIQAAQIDPRLTAPVAILFRNRTTEEATADELIGVLADIEDLIERQGDKKGE